MAVAAVLAMLTVRLLLDLHWSVPLLFGIALLSAVPFVVLGFVPSWSPAGRRVLRETIVAAGLVVFVCLIYSVLIVGLDRQARPAERSLVGLSMVAALAVAALAVPVRNRLARFAEHLVPGMSVRPQQALDDLSARMTRAVPMDELLLQMAETPAGHDCAGGSRGLGRLRRGSGAHGVGARPAAGAAACSAPTSSVSSRGPGSAATPGPRCGRRGCSTGGRTRSSASHRSATSESCWACRGRAARPAPGPFSEDEESSLAELARHTGLASAQRPPRLCPAGLARRAAAPKRRAPGLPRRASSRPPTSHGAGSSATSTTAPSSTWWRWRCG